MKFSRALRASEILQSFEGRKVFAGVELVGLACSNLRDFIHRVIEALAISQSKPKFVACLRDLGFH